MAWSKRQICEEAYAELALAGYVFDLSPEEMQRAGRRLDTMMALWDAKGIHLGYAISDSPDSVDLEGDSQLPLSAVEPVFLNLAVRLGAGIGKQLPAATLVKAKEGYDSVVLLAAWPRQQQMPGGVPLGAGHKSWTRPFTPVADTGPLQVADDGDLEFLEP